MHLLAIDPSTQMGWALFIDESDKPEDERRPINKCYFYGTWDLKKWDDGKKRESRGAYYINFLEQFRKLRRLHNIDDDQIKIVLEGEAYAAARTEASERLAAGWLAILESYCYRKDNIPPITATTDEWRHSFIRRSRAPKEIVGSDERRKWIKQATIAKCRSLGFNPKSDNDADALGLLFWLIHGGEEAQIIRKAENAAKKKAKRQQTKMDLKVAA